MLALETILISIKIKTNETTPICSHYHVWNIILNLCQQWKRVSSQCKWMQKKNTEGTKKALALWSRCANQLHLHRFIKSKQMRQCKEHEVLCKCWTMKAKLPGDHFHLSNPTKVSNSMTRTENGMDWNKNKTTTKPEIRYITEVSFLVIYKGGKFKKTEATKMLTELTSVTEEQDKKIRITQIPNNRTKSRYSNSHMLWMLK